MNLLPSKLFKCIQNLLQLDIKPNTCTVLLRIVNGVGYRFAMLYNVSGL